MIRALWRRVGPWLPWGAVLIVLALLVQSVQPAALMGALGHAQLWMLFLVLACSLLALLLRGLRWHLLLQAIAAPNTVLDSIILFTAAQAALLLPGGHFFVPVLQRSEHGTLIRRSAPTVLVQELIYGLLVVPAALPGVQRYQPAGWMLLVAFAVNAGLGLFMVQAWILRMVVRLGQRLPLIRAHTQSLLDLQQHFVVVARSPGAAWGTLLDAGTIGLGGLGLYIALLALGVHQATWIDTLSVYSLGSAVGGITALPGGLGANEAVSTLVLSHCGVAVGSAAAGTLLFRVTSLATGTLVGWTVLVLARRRLHIHPSLGGLAGAIRGAELQTGEGRDTR